MMKLIKKFLLVILLLSATAHAYLSPLEQQEINGYAGQSYTNKLYNNHRVKMSNSYYSSNVYTLILNFDVEDGVWAAVDDMRTDMNNAMVKKIANHWCSYAFDSLLKKGLMIDLRFFSKENGGEFMTNIINYGTCGAIKTGWYDPLNYSKNFNPKK
jgi:hypothetical protein